MSDEFNATGGVGFTGLLQVAFIVLKLTGVIKWSWLWVLAPAWLSLTFAMVILVLFIIVAFIAAVDRRKG